MRVLVASDRVDDLDPVTACAALVRGWERRAPHVEATACPLSDGGPGFLSVAAAALRTTAEVTGSGVPVVRQGGSAVLASHDDAGRAWSAGALGEAVGELTDQGASRVVIGLGDLAEPDAGGAFLAGLGGRHDDPRPARARLQGTRLVAAASSDRVLLGLQGVCAAAVELFGVDPRAAQEAEARQGEWAASVLATQSWGTDLLTGRARRPDREPGAGAGGGLGFAVEVAGGRVLPGPAVAAELAGLSARLHGCAVAVTAAGVFDWRLLEGSVAARLAQDAAAAAVPVVLLAREVAVGRRESMSAGLAGCYAASAGAAPPFALPVDPPLGQERLADLAARVAATWTPSAAAANYSGGSGNRSRVRPVGSGEGPDSATCDTTAKDES